jgi:nucleoside-triphosphatase THEP1
VIDIDSVIPKVSKESIAQNGYCQICPDGGITVKYFMGSHRACVCDHLIDDFNRKNEDLRKQQEARERHKRFEETGVYGICPVRDFSTLGDTPHERIIKEFISFRRGETVNGKTIKKSVGLFIYGDSGLGKTYAAETILWNLRKDGISAFMFKSMELANMLIENKKSLDYKMILRDVDVLIIDEIGRGNNSNFVIQEYFRILDDRLCQNKSTIFVSNFSPDSRDPLSLFSVWSKSISPNIMETILKPLFSRINSNCRKVKFTGADRRKQMNGWEFS